MELTRLANSPSIVAVLERMHARAEQPALLWNGREFSYAELLHMSDEWLDRVASMGIGHGAVCGILADYSPQVCALFLALMRQASVLVPFGHPVEPEVASLLPVAGVQHLFRFAADDSWTLEHLPPVPSPPLLTEFLVQDRPGLVVFTSGSTGKPKAILHDCERVMKKFVVLRDPWRTILFLMIDHFGGFNTLLSNFAYGGTGVCPSQRTPEVIARLIEASRSTLLPTTPTFLNLLIASRVYRQFDLSSIRLITYGTEVMPEATLQKVHEIFPSASVKQTYGLSELGVLRSRSEADGSVWVKVGGDGFDVKVRDGILWVRSEANMVGYLNAPSPFDADGWMCTGDQVEVRGEYLRFLGRQSEMINVGGQKVFPAEVEGVLLQMQNVREATVYGARDPLMGQVVHARVALDGSEDPERASERLRRGCLEKLARYKVPVRLTVVALDELRNERFKKIREGLER